MARALRNRSTLARFAAWQSRIVGWDGQVFRAKELYCGGAWSVVRRIAQPNDNRRYQLNCFVISAGYGLIQSEAQIAPYAATFAIGQPDSVTPLRGQLAPTANAEWWKKLSTWRPPRLSGPRSIRAAFRKSPTSIHLFALSPGYLDAIANDLAEARSELRNPEKLIIISAGKKRHGDLNGSVIGAPGQLQSILGGALVSLNVRLAAEILKGIPAERLSYKEVRRFVSRLLRRARSKRIRQRRKSSDSEVAKFIRRSAMREFSNSYTTLLDAYREAGYACEMKRFKRLYQNVRR